MLSLALLAASVAGVSLVCQQISGAREERSASELARASVHLIRTTDAFVQALQDHRLALHLRRTAPPGAPAPERPKGFARARADFQDALLAHPRITAGEVTRFSTAFAGFERAEAVARARPDEERLLDTVARINRLVEFTDAIGWVAASRRVPAEVGIGISSRMRAITIRENVSRLRDLLVLLERDASMLEANEIAELEDRIATTLNLLRQGHHRGAPPPSRDFAALRTWLPALDGPAPTAALAGAREWIDTHLEEVRRNGVERNAELVARGEELETRTHDRTLTAGLASFGILVGIVALCGAVFLLRRMAAEASLSRHASEAAAAYLDRLRTALDQHALVSETDAAGLFTAVNDKFCAASGYPREELLGQTHPLVDSDRQSAETLRELRETVRAGGIWKGQIENRRKDGSAFWTDETIVPFLGPDGVSARFLSIARDITLRKQTEAELKRLSVVARHTTTGVVITDPLGRIEWINDASRRLAGLTDDAAIGRTLPELVGGPDAAVIEQAIRAGGGHRGELLLHRTDGRTRWVRLGLDPVADDSGGTTHFVGIVDDVTEARELRTRVTAAHDLLVQTQKLGRIGGWEFDLGRRRLVWSEMTYALHDVPAGAPLEWHDCTRFVADGHRERLGRLLLLAIRRCESWDTEVEIRSAGGRRFWARIQGAPVVAEGRVTKLVGTIQDIDERKHLSLALEDTNRRLGSSIAEAERLAKEARVATEAKSLFLASMSHEIRTPMNGVIGFINLLKGTALSGEQRDYVDQIQNCGDALLDLINDVLDFSKIESGRLDLEKAPFSLRDLVTSSIETVLPRALERRLEILFDIDPAVPLETVGDPARIRQVLLNLMSNAVKFTRDGEIHVGVGVLPADSADGARLRIAVRDTGIGIEPAAAARLFTPFTQADASTTRRFGGTGLGLAISKRLVELMGGSIGVESTPGEGSTFSFTIRVEVSVRHGIRTPVTTGLADRSALLVVPNRAVRAQLCTALTAAGLRVHATDTGAKALALLPSLPPFDFAILDHEPADMPLADLAAGLAADPSFAPLRRLHLAFRAQPRPEGFSSLFEGSIVKPVDTSRLAAELAARPGAAPAPSPAEPSGQDLAAAAVRVLVAEDNPVNQRVIRLLLRRLGIEADLAGDGREAVARVAAGDYDLVLMDMQMPELDGLGATREIRGLAELRRQPMIVALTANALAGDAERCLEAGMDDYLSKPVKPDQVAETVRRAIERRVAPAPVPKARPTWTKGPHRHHAPARTRDVRT